MLRDLGFWCFKRVIGKSGYFRVILYFAFLICVFDALVTYLVFWVLRVLGGFDCWVLGLVICIRWVSLQVVF